MGSALQNELVIRLNRVVLCLALIVALASCGDDPADPVPPPSPSPIPSTPEAEAATSKYRSIDALAGALEEAGLECTDLTHLKQDNRTLKDFALCDPDSDPLQRLDIYLFENAKHRDRWIGSIVQSGLPWLLGPNWIVVAAGDPESAEQRLASVQEAIGGQIPEVKF